VVGLDGVDGDAGFDGSELLETFELLEGRRGQGDQALKDVGPIEVNAQMTQWGNG
jgi:hypothetical protein